MKLKFNIFDEIMNTIYKTSKIKKYYMNTFPNTKYSFKQIFEEICYYLSNNVSFKNIRSNMHYNTIYFHLNRLKKYKIFERTYNRLINNSNIKKNLNGILTDTSFIKNVQGINKLGRNKYFKNKKAYKLSLFTDLSGVPFSILIEPSNIHDIVILKKHLKETKNIIQNKNINILADKGYCSKKIRNEIKDLGCKPIIAYNKRNCKNIDNIPILNNDEKRIYKKRIIVENIFCYIKKYKSIEMMNMKYYSSYKNLLYLALLRIFF